MLNDPIPDYRPLVVGIGGTLQDNSSSEKAARIVLKHAEELGAETVMFAGRDLMFPPYDPSSRERHPNAVALLEALDRARGVVISSPSYHGVMSGLLKNALDYTEDMGRSERPYLSGRAIGCIGCGAGEQGAVSTLTSIRMIAHALRGWPTSVGAAINTSQPVFGPDGDCLNDKVDGTLKIMAQQIIRFGRMQHLAYTFDPEWAHWFGDPQNAPWRRT